MTCDVIATGSKGNAVLLNGKYLFDCGIAYGRMKDRLRDLRAVFLTHIHQDHFNRAAIKKIHRLRPAVRFVCGRNLLVPLCGECGIDPANVILVEPGKPVSLHYGPEYVDIQCFDLIHNVENVGWAVKLMGGDEPGTALYATDTQYIPIIAPGLDLYMVEKNYHMDELQARKERKIAEGKFTYEDNVVLSHMSAETIDNWLAQNAAPHSQIVFLHQHIDSEKEVAEVG